MFVVFYGFYKNVLIYSVKTDKDIYLYIRDYISICRAISLYKELNLYIRGDISLYAHLFVLFLYLLIYIYIYTYIGRYMSFHEARSLYKRLDLYTSGYLYVRTFGL